MAFERVYTREQKEAAISAALDRRVSPHRRIVEIARAGLLPGLDGKPLDPFELNFGTLRSWLKDERRKRDGLKQTQMARKPHRDAVEELRSRLIACADAMLADFEKTVRQRPGSADPERLRQITRAVREAAPLTPKDQPPAPKPGAKVDGTQHGGQTRPGPSGLSNRIMADMRAGETARETTHTTETPHGEDAVAGVAQTKDEGATSTEDGEPGSLARDFAASI